MADIITTLKADLVFTVMERFCDGTQFLFIQHQWERFKSNSKHYWILWKIAGGEIMIQYVVVHI